MDRPTQGSVMLSAEQHAIAAQELLVAGPTDEATIRRARVEATLAGATAVLQLSEILTALGSLLAAHPVLAHALAARQSILELEQKVEAAQAPRRDSPAARRQ